MDFLTQQRILSHLVHQPLTALTWLCLGLTKFHFGPIDWETEGIAITRTTLQVYCPWTFRRGSDQLLDASDFGTGGDPRSIRVFNVFELERDASYTESLIDSAVTTFDWDGCDLVLHFGSDWRLELHDSRKQQHALFDLSLPSGEIFEFAPIRFIV